jgi:membrane associated rhomboid family serine protease
MNRPQMQMSAPPFTGAVKALVITNLVVWIGLILILQGLILRNSVIFDYFALIPSRTITQFWVWQIFTYMFLHASGVFHVLFNMMVLWFFGSELESRWGRRFFTTYYLVCGVGAGIIYLIGSFAYAFMSGSVGVMEAPLVGASGATYGLLLAYGILYGEREIYFMMLFPMKAKYFVMIIGAVEMVTLLDAGMGSQTANLAHLGGIAVGFAFLSFVARWRAREAGGSSSSKRGRKLKLVVNNDRVTDKNGNDKGPRYWN